MSGYGLFSRGFSSSPPTPLPGASTNFFGVMIATPRFRKYASRSQRSSMWSFSGLGLMSSPTRPTRRGVPKPQGVLAHEMSEGRPRTRGVAYQGRIPFTHALSQRTFLPILECGRDQWRPWALSPEALGQRGERFESVRETSLCRSFIRLDHAWGQASTGSTSSSIRTSPSRKETAPLAIVPGLRS